MSNELSIKELTELSLQVVRNNQDNEIPVDESGLSPVEILKRASKK